MRRKKSNTPLKTVEMLAPMVQGKTLCDLGCGDGEFLINMSKYCEVTGIEYTKENFELCTSKGLKLIFGDLRGINWPQADFYYSYPFYHDVGIMMEKVPTTLIIGSEPHKFDNFPKELCSQIVLDVLPNWRIAIWKRKK